jgi:hypothetical protein
MHMPAASSPPIVPYGADETVFVVMDNFGAPGSIHRQVECIDFDTVINALLTGLFNDPVQVVAFNTLEHWTRDMSAEVANEIVARCDIEATPMPEHLGDFVRRHAGVDNWRVRPVIQRIIASLH